MVFSWLLLRLLLLIFVAKAVVSLSIEVQLKLRGLIMICRIFAVLHVCVFGDHREVNK